MFKNKKAIRKRRVNCKQEFFVDLHRENGRAEAAHCRGQRPAENGGGAMLTNPVKNSPTQPPTYAELLDQWVFSSKTNIKESTEARYTHLINTHIKPHLGEYDISRLSSETVEGFIRAQLSDGRLDGSGGLSEKTVADILTIIKSTTEYAACKGYIPSCNLNKVTVRKREKKMRVLSRTEQSLLVNVLIDRMNESKFGVLLSLYTGIRIGELCALQWEDFDLSSATLKIRKTMQRIQVIDGTEPTRTKIIITEPKSQCSVRDIPLPPFIVDYAVGFAKQGKAYILTGEENRFTEPRTMQNRFKSYVSKSGIDDANFHSLRHTFATRCVEYGFEIKSLSEILGHSTVNITLNKYVHSSFELKRSNMNKLSLPR